MTTSVVLDSWAILLYLRSEGPTAAAVEDLLAADAPIVSWINLGEVFYILRRRVGDAEAQRTIRDLQAVTTPELPTAGRVLQAARIKADYPLSYADAFAAATAVAHHATLWTGDPELLITGAPWTWRDLRPRPIGVESTE